MFFKILFFKSLQISQENTCVAIFFNKVTGPKNSNFITKRLQYIYFLWILWVVQKHLFVWRIYEWLVLKHQCNFSRTRVFTEYLEQLLLAVSSFQPATLLKKGLQQRRFCIICKIFKNIFWQNTSGWLLFVFACEKLFRFSFEKFFRSPIL